MRYRSGVHRAATAAALASVVACSSTEAPPAPAPAPPGDGPVVTALEPRTGSGGETVRIEAQGFPADRMLHVGFGPPASEYEIVGSVESAADGSVSATFAVPEWAEPDQAYLVVVADGYVGPKAVSDAFHVAGPNGVVTAVGQITAGGIECPSLETADGSLYTLLGDGARDVLPGTDVRVTGTVADASFCMQGIPIAVETIERLE